MTMSEPLCANGLNRTLRDIIYRVNQVEKNLKADIAQKAISIEE